MIFSRPKDIITRQIILEVHYYDIREMMKDLILTILHLTMLKHFLLYYVIFWMYQQDYRGNFVKAVFYQC